MFWWWKPGGPAASQSPRVRVASGDAVGEAIGVAKRHPVGELCDHGGTEGLVALSLEGDVAGGHVEMASGLLDVLVIETLEQDAQWRARGAGQVTKFGTRATTVLPAGERLPEVALVVENVGGMSTHTWSTRL